MRRNFYAAVETITVADPNPVCSHAVFGHVSSVSVPALPYCAAFEKVGTAFALRLLKEPIPALFVRRTTVKILYLLTLFIVAIATSACNTTRGFGQDVEATGDAIENTAEDAMDNDDNE